MSDANDRVLLGIARFFERWGESYAEMAQSFRDLLTEDCEMKISSFPTTRGPEEAIRLVLDPSREAMGLETIGVEIFHMSRDGSLVWCERVDHLTRGDGSVIASIPIMAIMELTDDHRIGRLREYPDASQRHPDALKFVPGA